MTLRFYRLLFVLPALLCMVALASCDGGAQRKLEEARLLLAERPDSAGVLLREIDYSDFNTDSLRAKYILVKAMANTRTGRSLITDTLLNEAGEYYYNAGDTTNWVLASMMLAGHDFFRGEPSQAIGRMDNMLVRVSDPGLLWDISLRRIEFSWGAQDYEGVIAHADRMLNNTNVAHEKLRFATLKAAALSMLGRDAESAALADSICRSDFLPEKYSPEWADFMTDYAELIDLAGRSREAIAVMDELREHCPSPHPAEELSRTVSLAQFYANAGDAVTAKSYLDCIELDSIASSFEPYASVGMLKTALQFKMTGRFPSNLMHRVTKRIDLHYRYAQFDRQTAIESVMELNADKYELKLQKQRLWMAVIAAVLVLTIVSAMVYVLLRRRRHRMIEAEERAETLALMLSEARDAGAENPKLKAAMLRQLGILKAFAGTPTPQSRDALMKISRVGADDGDVDALVNWTGFYQMTDELYDGFYSQVVKLHPGEFSDKELQIIMLLKSGFSTKEIGVLTEQSSATIYVRKTAIRKKLHTPPDGDFIAQLEAETSAC